MKSEQDKEINVTWIKKKRREAKQLNKQMREAVVREQNECISDFRGGMTTGE